MMQKTKVDALCNILSTDIFDLKIIQNKTLAIAWQGRPLS